LTAKDLGGSSDPFLQISHGSGLCHLIDDKQRSLRKNTLNPDFYTSYEFEAMLPGDSEIQISVYDYDAIGSNEIIGSTLIDIENRWLNPSWRAMPNKPMEIRPLKLVSSRASQGSLEMWVDIFSESVAKITPRHHIEPPLPEPWELRVIIWKTANCVNKDEGSSDLYVSCQLEGNEESKQNTDTHWKSEDGTGNFNYRMKFPLALPASSSLIKVSNLFPFLHAGITLSQIQIWDKDLVGSDDSLGEISLNLRSLMRKAFQTKKRQSIDEKWLQIMHPNFEGVQGEVLVSFELLTQGTVPSKFHSVFPHSWCSGFRKISQRTRKKKSKPAS
jgi:hypothetical protein